MSPFVRGGDRPDMGEYRLASPLAECGGCWKARARAVLWVASTCRVCGRVHRAPRFRPRFHHRRAP